MVRKTIILLASLVAAVSAATTTKAPKQKVHKVSSKAPKAKAPKYKAAKSKSPKYKSPKYKSPKSQYKAPKSRRSSQQAPTTDRYKEIQHALAGKVDVITATPQRLFGQCWSHACQQQTLGQPAQRTLVHGRQA